MKLERTKNTVRGIATGLLSRVVTLALPFAVRTLLIWRIGIEYAGLSGLFSSILQVLSLAELGFSAAVVFHMYDAVARDDEAAVCALLRFYRGVYRCVGGAILIGGLAVLPFLSRLIEGDAPSDINLQVLYLVYLGNAVLSYFLYAYRNALLEAYQRVDVVHLLQAATQGAVSLLQVAVILLTENYYLYVLAIPAATLLNNLLVRYETGRLFPQYSCRGQVPSETRQKMRRLIMGLMASRACWMSRNGFDGIFISTFLGLSMMAVYTNYFVIMSSVTSLMGIITDSMTAGIGNSLRQETREENYKSMRRFEFMYMWIAGWFTAALFTLYQPFMRLWMGDAYTLDLWMAGLFSAYFYVLKMGDINSTYYGAAGYWWYGKRYVLAEAVANLFLNFLLIRAFGIHGVITGTLLSLFAFGICARSRILFKRYFWPGCTAEHYRLHGVWAIAAVGNCALTYAICQMIPGDGWMRLLGQGVLCAAVPNVLFYIVYHRTERYREACRWARGHLHSCF